MLQEIGVFFSDLKHKIVPEKTEEVIDTEEVKIEFWQMDSEQDDIRFECGEEDGYAVAVAEDKKDGLEFSFNRKNLYAWSINPLYRYRDFVAVAEIDFGAFAKPDFDTSTGRSGDFAGGLILRYISDNAFYALLVSNAGWLRLDAVFNSTPLPVLGWIKPSNLDFSDTVKIAVVMTGTRISIAVNDEWLATCVDDTVQAAGKIGIAGQNWQSYQNTAFKLRSFSIFSEPLTVEAADSTLNARENIRPEARVNFARTLVAMGSYEPALYQMKAIAEQRELNLEEHLLAGQIYFARRLLEEAEGEFLSAHRLEPKEKQPIIELLNVYYYADNTEKMETFFADIDSEILESSSIILNLKGHFLHAQKKYLESAQAYEQAGAVDKTQGLFLWNAAREYGLANEQEKAIAAYLDAGARFLIAQEYNDLSNVVDVLERIAPKNIEAQKLFAKFFYAIENYSDAMLYLQPLCEADSDDAGIWYLYGMMQDEDNRQEAIRAFKKACELEADYGLYLFRLAETLYLCGEPFEKELKAALKADAENGWIHNLAALAALDAEDYTSAKTSIVKARKLLPNEPIILENFFEVQRCLGNLEPCVELCSESPDKELDEAVQIDRAAAFYALANAFFTNAEYERAKEWFDKALAENPKDVDIMIDYAQNAIQLNLFQEADDYLGKSLDIEPTIEAYELIALLARQMGDLARVEVTLRHAREEFGDTANLLYHQCLLYADMKKFSKAEQLLPRLLELEPDSDRVKALRAQITQP